MDRAPIMHKKLFKIYAFLSFASLYQPAYASIVLAGDGTADQTFSFPIFAHAYEKTRGFLFVGAQQPPLPEAAAYALSFVDGSSKKFIPLVGAQKATINGKAEQPNPLFGAGINQLSLLVYNKTTIFPVAVTQAEPSVVYLMQSSVIQNPSPFTLLSTGALVDADNNPTPRIAALTTNYPVTVHDSLKLPAGLQLGMAVFAAVTNSTGVFGQQGSGIATSVIQTNTTTNLFEFTTIPTIALDVTSSVASIGAPLVAMHDFVTLSTCVQTPPLSSTPKSQVYVGLQIEGGAAEHAGVCGVALLYGNLTGTNSSWQTPTLHPIVTSSAVTADSIVAAVGACAAVNIYAIAHMKTTTHLRYLLAVGGVAPYGNRRTVFAMPLVTETGLLANVNSKPADINTSYYPFAFIGRSLAPATQQGDLYTSASVQARVGAGDAPGDVEEIIVSGDAVFIAIAHSSNSQPTIFYSQALFDELGLVKGWTNWRPAGNTTTATAGLALDEYSGNFWSFISTATGVYTVKKTAWQAPQQGVQNFLQKQFSSVPGGIQGLFDFPAATRTLGHHEPVALTVATGNNQLVIAQSGQSDAGILTPVTDFSHGFASTDGSLQGFVPGVTSLTLSGGVLAQLGPIIAATIITDGTYGWFAVAGAKGVALLARPDGTGWLVSSGLGNGFAHLTADMQWVMLGNYSAVRKLVADQNTLYILTQSVLERVALSPALVQKTIMKKNAPLASTVLAQGANLPGGLHYFLSDVIISQKVALLATSSGLLRVGNGTDISTAMDAHAVRWTPVALPDSVGPVTRLYGVSVSGLEEDLVQCAPNISGNVYALNAYVGYDQTRVYRFTIQYDGTITDETVQQLPDVKVKSERSFFLTFGHYRNHITTDGAIFSVSRSKYLEKPSLCELLPPYWTTGLSEGIIKNAATAVKDPQAHTIGHMIRSSVTGSWLVPGEFGLFVNE